MSVHSDGEKEEIGSSVSCCTGAPSRATTAPPVLHRHESDVSEELTTDLSQQQSSCSCVRPCNIAAACPLHIVEALASEAGTTT